MKTFRYTAMAMAAMMAAGMHAQTTFDAGKLIEEDLNGTARYVSMGGAMSAFGNDISTISHNPAGIGAYRHADLNLTLSMAGSSTWSTGSHMGAQSGNIKSDIFGGLDNIGMVLAGDEFGNHLNFAFSYRRLQNMDRTVTYADAIFDADGYEAYRDFQDHQRNKVGSYDFNLSYNADDKAYFGVTFGILSTDTWSEGYIWDRYEAGKHPDFPDGLNYLNVDEMNTSTGNGWNVAFGTILRPVPGLRLGAAFKSPTLFSQTLAYSDFLFDDHANSNADGLPDPIHLSSAEKFTKSVEYSFTSPWSLNFSAGLTAGHTALGIEYERNFTGRTSLSVNNSRLSRQGACDLRDYSTFSIGLEQNIDKVSLRAGFNTTSPMYNSRAYADLSDTEFNMMRKDCQTDMTGRRSNLTAGLGYCSAPEDGTQFYIDFAYVHSIRKSQFSLYPEDLLTDYKHTTDKCMLTLGLCF